MTRCFATENAKTPVTAIVDPTMVWPFIGVPNLSEYGRGTHGRARTEPASIVSRA